MGSDNWETAADEDELCSWLQEKAKVGPQIIAESMDKLRAEEVFTVDDLQVLRQEGGLREVFSRVTARKVEDALSALAALSINNEEPEPDSEAVLVTPPRPVRKSTAAAKKATAQAGDEDTSPTCQLGDEVMQIDPSTNQHLESKVYECEVECEGSPPSSSASAEAADGFTAADCFQGARPGQTFQMGVHGLGYYTLAPAVAATKPPLTREQQHTALLAANAARHDRRRAEAEAQAVAEAEAARSRRATMLASIKGQRLSARMGSKRRGKIGADMHLPKEARLDRSVWEFLQDLPDALDGAADSGVDTARLNDFFNRVLPRASVEQAASIHNEEGEHDMIFDVAAPADDRTSALRALGWTSGEMPTKAELRESILERVEMEHVDEVLFAGSCFMPRSGGGGGSGEDSWRDDDDIDYSCGDNGTYDNFAYRSW